MCVDNISVFFDLPRSRNVLLNLDNVFLGVGTIWLGITLWHTRQLLAHHAMMACSKVKCKTSERARLAACEPLRSRAGLSLV